MNVLISVANFWDKVGFRVAMDFQPNSLSIRKREPPFVDEYQITLGDEENGKSLTVKKEDLKKLADLINALANETI